MRKVCAILAVALILPTVAWAVCCSSITAGPTAWAPTFSKTGCSNSYKASYGGTVNVQADATNIYMTTVQQTAKLLQMVPGHPNAVIASKGPFGTDIRCNANTGLAVLTPTPTCAILSKTTCFTRYTVTTTACPTVPAVTQTVDSDQVTSP